MNEWAIFLAFSVAILALNPTAMEAVWTYMVESGDALSKSAATTKKSVASSLISVIIARAGEASIKRKSRLDYFLQDTTKVKMPITGCVVFFKNTYSARISPMGGGQFIHAGSKVIGIFKMLNADSEERVEMFKLY